MRIVGGYIFGSFNHRNISKSLDYLKKGDRVIYIVKDVTENAGDSLMDVHILVGEEGKLRRVIEGVEVKVEKKLSEKEISKIVEDSSLKGTKEEVVYKELRDKIRGL